MTYITIFHGIALGIYKKQKKIERTTLDKL